ncbi:MAG: EamA family transporter [Candidatus Dormibacteria bacterium]
MAVLAVLLGVGAGFSYGAGDFAGGLCSRTLPAVTVAALSQLVGVGLLLLALPFLGVPMSFPAIIGGLPAGVAGGLGVALLYRGLALGRMSVVSPITGVGSAAIPVLFALVSGERPHPVALAGVALAIVAIVLVSATPDPRQADGGSGLPPGVLEALGAAVGFGCFFIFLRLAPAAGLWPLVGARISSITLLMLGVVFSRGQRRAGPRELGLLLLTALFDMSANVLYLLGVRVGLLSLVAALTALYPASTVLLSRVVLSERLALAQQLGLGMAAAGIVLIVTG